MPIIAFRYPNIFSELTYSKWEYLEKDDTDSRLLEAKDPRFDFRHLWLYRFGMIDAIEGRRASSPIRKGAVSWRAIREISSSNAVTSRRRKGLQLNESEMKISSVEGVRYRSPAVRAARILSSNTKALHYDCFVRTRWLYPAAISAIAGWYHGVAESLASCHSSVKGKRRDPPSTPGDTDGDRRIETGPLSSSGLRTNA
ncbi:hypothetical protein V1478_006678 [Vespula squamosa]|uniref:Uncharacterized protein n=1 Tax=Vespula squamosa TaxID=30214 RepID=A0ABD2B8J6_VESSQ